MIATKEDLKKLKRSTDIAIQLVATSVAEMGTIVTEQGEINLSTFATKQNLNEAVDSLNRDIRDVSAKQSWQNATINELSISINGISNDVEALESNALYNFAHTLKYEEDTYKLQLFNKHGDDIATVSLSSLAQIALENYYELSYDDGQLILVDNYRDHFSNIHLEDIIKINYDWRIDKLAIEDKDGNTISATELLPGIRYDGDQRYAPIGAFADVYYHESERELIFTSGDPTHPNLYTIDCSKFIKDGMIRSAEVATNRDGKAYLCLWFNQDGPEEPIQIPIEDLFKATNYVSKDEVDDSMLPLNSSNSNHLLTKLAINRYLTSDSADGLLYVYDQRYAKSSDVYNIQYIDENYVDTIVWDAVNYRLKYTYGEGDMDEEYQSVPITGFVKTSELASSVASAGFVKTTNLAEVATSGSYNDLTDQPVTFKVASPSTSAYMLSSAYESSWGINQMYPTSTYLPNYYKGGTVGVYSPYGEGVILNQTVSGGRNLVTGGFVVYGKNNVTGSKFDGKGIVIGIANKICACNSAVIGMNNTIGHQTESSAIFGENFTGALVDSLESGYYNSGLYSASLIAGSNNSSSRFNASLTTSQAYLSNIFMLGSYLTATQNNETIVGRYNSTSYATGLTPIFIVGTGTSEDDRDNGLVVYSDNTIWYHDTDKAQFMSLQTALHDIRQDISNSLSSDDVNTLIDNSLAFKRQGNGIVPYNISSYPESIGAGSLVLNSTSSSPGEVYATNTLVVGYGHTVEGFNSIVAGSNNTVGVNNSLIAGTSNTVVGKTNSTNSIYILGHNNKITSQNGGSIALGLNNTITNAIFGTTIGSGNTINAANFSAAIGFGNVVNNSGEVAVGKFNQSTRVNTAFSAGIGSMDSDRKNGLEVLYNGEIIYNSVVSDSKSSSNGTGTPVVLQTKMDEIDSALDDLSNDVAELSETCAAKDELIPTYTVGTPKLMYYIGDRPVYRLVLGHDYWKNKQVDAVVIRNERVWPAVDLGDALNKSNVGHIIDVQISMFKSYGINQYIINTDSYHESMFFQFDPISDYKWEVSPQSAQEAYGDVLVVNEINDLSLSLENGTFKDAIDGVDFNFLFDNSDSIRNIDYCIIDYMPPEPDYVDLGLPSGTLWAKGNLVKDANGNYSIGKETDQGAYFSWGNIEGHNKDEGYVFSEENYKSTPGALLTSNIASDDAEHDAARANLGAPWHLPNEAEYEELRDYCNKNIDTVDGVTGIRVTSKINGNSIFFPVFGFYYRTFDSTYDFSSSESCYWVSELVDWSTEYALIIDCYPEAEEEFDQFISGEYWVGDGLSIRPVRSAQ